MNAARIAGGRCCADASPAGRPQGARDPLSSGPPRPRRLAVRRNRGRAVCQPHRMADGRLLALDTSEGFVEAGRSSTCGPGWTRSGGGAGGARQPLPPPGREPPPGSAGCARVTGCGSPARVAGDHRSGPCAGNGLRVQRRAERPDRRRPDPAQDLAGHRGLAGRAGSQPAGRFPEARSSVFASCRTTAWCCPRTAGRSAACTPGSSS